MALDYKLLKAKPIISRVIDGESVQYYDLLAKTFNNVNELTLYHPTMVVVNAHYIARPDLISLAAYGTDKYADIICKVNGISNPFEMNEDYILLLPSVDMISKIDFKPQYTHIINKYAVSDKELESEYYTDEDNDKTEHIGTKERTFKKLLSDRRSSNEQSIEDSNYVLSHNQQMIFY